jgi:hypothetical protein
VFSDQARQRADKRLSFENAGVRGNQCACGAYVWLARGNGGRVNYLQILHAIGCSRRAQLLERGDFALVVGHYELSAAPMRNPVGRAKLVQPPRTFDAMPRFE